MAGAFTLFTPLFQEFDRIIASFTGEASARVIAAITPVVAASLALWFAWWALTVLTGKSQESIGALLWRIGRTSLILSVALGAEHYQGTVGEVVRTAPDALAAAVMGGEASLYDGNGQAITIGPSSVGAAGLIDVAAGKGIVAGLEAMKMGSLFEKQGIALFFFGTCILLATVAMVGIGGANILVAKVVLGVLVALGPLFIAALVFDSTRRFFERWTAMVATYALMIALFAALFTFMLGIFQHYVDQVRFDGTQNVGYAVVGALLLSIVTILVTREVKVVALGLGGGVVLSGGRFGQWLHMPSSSAPPPPPRPSQASAPPPPPPPRPRENE